VRFWAVRFIGDDPGEYSELLSLLTERAKVETDCRVRSQLACTAKRLPAAAALAIVKGLATHTEDAADPFIPLLIWWAIERHCDDGRRLVLDWMQDEALWNQAIFREAVVPRLARRFASTGRTDEFQACAAVLDIAGKYGAFDAALTAAEADLLPMANTPEPIRPILDRLRAQTPQRRSSVQFGMKFHQDWAIQAANEAIVDRNSFSNRCADPSRKTAWRWRARCFSPTDNRNSTKRRWPRFVPSPIPPLEKFFCKEES
jgi:hypothetical protein